MSSDELKKEREASLRRQEFEPASEQGRTAEDSTDPASASADATQSGDGGTEGVEDTAENLSGDKNEHEVQETEAADSASRSVDSTPPDHDTAAGSSGARALDQGETAPSVRPQPRSPVWAQLPGMRMVPIDSIDPSPFRARFVPTWESVQPLYRSLAEGMQPLRPLEVRGWTGKDEREQLLKGHRTLLALRHGFGLTHVAVVDVEIEDDLEAAYYVNGDNDSDYDDSFWEHMRRVGHYVRTGGKRTKQRHIAVRHTYTESEVSELKYWDQALTPAVLKQAGVDEQVHQKILVRLERSHLRDLRACESDDLRARLLQNYVFGDGLKKVETPLEEIEAYVTYQPSGSDWMAVGGNLDDLTDQQFRALCKYVVQGLTKHRQALHKAKRAKRNRTEEK